MKKLVVVAALALSGCVQIQFSMLNARAARTTAHQDVGRVTSSEQSGSLDVPVSLVPQ